MSDSNHTLEKLFNKRVFVIPDYQRGYAWEEKECKDLVDDVEALSLKNTVPNIKHHYTGTIVTYLGSHGESLYDSILSRCVDVVDGQQRLTTICLFLSRIISALIKNGRNEYTKSITKYLYHNSQCRLTLGYDTERIFFQLLKHGRASIEALTDHHKRLIWATEYFSDYVEKQLKDSDRGINFLESLFQTITSRLIFTEYAIDEECEVGMTFELMNARGKQLSVMELLKNYFMYWIAYNGADTQERNEFSRKINGAWKDIYLNLGRSTSCDESQCLRVAWTLYCNHQPRVWNGYKGFKEDAYFPLRGFDEFGRARIKKKLEDFIEGLVDVSRHYSMIIAPDTKICDEGEEESWLQRINRTDHVANFLPLLVTASLKCESRQIRNEDFIKLMKALECYAYRVFLLDGKRSNAGKTAFFRWGWELFHESVLIDYVIAEVYRLIHHYVRGDVFEKKINEIFGWYNHRLLLKYTLFEYEQYLLDEYHEGRNTKISWKEIKAKDSTIEHILPQNPKPDSDWLRNWTEEQRKKYLHDIGNLVLTMDNAKYGNSEFAKKKGSIDGGICYTRADFRQERDIALYINWTEKELLNRREKITNWILDNWKLPDALPSEIVEKDIDYDTPDDEGGV